MYQGSRGMVPKVYPFTRCHSALREAFAPLIGEVPPYLCLWECFAKNVAAQKGLEVRYG